MHIQYTFTPDLTIGKSSGRKNEIIEILDHHVSVLKESGDNRRRTARFQIERDTSFVEVTGEEGGCHVVLTGRNQRT